MRRALLSCAAILAIATGTAPAAAPQVTATALPGVSVIEIRTAANSTITFRITAPKAKDVRVFVDTMPQSTAQPLVRDDTGIWSGTLGPLEPDIYAAACVVDGAMAIAGYAHVTGSTPQAWDPRKVPHGAVHQRWYQLADAGRAAQRLRLPAARRPIAGTPSTRRCTCCMAAAASKRRGSSTAWRTSSSTT